MMDVDAEFEGWVMLPNDVIEKILLTGFANNGIFSGQFLKNHRVSMRKPMMIQSRVVRTGRWRNTSP